MAGAKLHLLLDQTTRETAKQVAKDLDEALATLDCELSFLRSDIKALQDAIAPMADEIRQSRLDIDQLLRERSYLQSP